MKFPSIILNIKNHMTERYLSAMIAKILENDSDPKTMAE
jgi:hypothetical protein